MILLTRLNGERFALNVDLIERVEMTPDTVITMTHGAKHVVSESVDEVIDEVRTFKASVLALAQVVPGAKPPDAPGRDGLRLVQPGGTQPGGSLPGGPLPGGPLPGGAP